MPPVYVPDLVYGAAEPSECADRPAVLSTDGEITYRELWARVGRTARQLTGAGVQPGDHVGLYLPRSTDYVTSLLAIMTLGAVAVPMDPEFPTARVRQVVTTARPRVIVGTDPAPRDHELVPKQTRWLPVRHDRTDVAPLSPEERWRHRAARDHPALILFTSGSTGRPKGVRLHHAGLVNRLAWGQRRYKFDTTDRVLHKASVAFDAAMHEIFSPLIAGGVLVVAPPGLQFDSLGLVRLIQEAAVTTAHFVPSVLRHVLDEEELEYCTSLRRVFCGGEALDMAMVRRLRALLPCAVFNQYGPTETSVNVTSWDCAEPYSGDIAPIGRPIDGATCHVLDERLTPVPAGQTGELWIGGVAVGAGYLDDDALTEQRFRPDPFGSTPVARMYRTGDLVRVAPAGYLEFRGRVDDQVKVRGVRVEPGEVGAVLRRHPQVHDAAVLAVADPPDGVRLVAYVAARPAHSPVVNGLRRIALPNGLPVATPSPDETLFIYRQIFEQDEYARFGLRVPAGAVVVDVGANIGLFGLWAHQQAADVRIVAVEPNPDVLAYLRTNLGLPGVRAEVVPVAVTDRTGTETLTSFPQLSYLSGLGTTRAIEAAHLVRSHYRQVAAANGGSAAAVDAPEIDGLLRDAVDRLRPTTHTVATTDLSGLFDLVGLDRVDLLKINAEGSEVSALRGIRAEHWPVIGQVCVELERSSVTGPAATEMLRAAGFTVHQVRDWSVGPDADVTYLYATRDPGPRPVRPRPRSRPAPDHPTMLLTVREVRRYAAAALPAAMRPAQVVFVEHLPRLPNGKVDRHDLPAPPDPAPRSADAAPRASGNREVLREVWRQVLGVDQVGDDDDFVSLGGHSLLALRVSTRVRHEVGVAPAPGRCLRSTSFAQWAAEVLCACGEG